MITESHRSLLHLIATAGPISRSDLAEMLGLSKPAMTGLTRTLIEAGIVREGAIGKPSLRQGRPSVLLSLNPAYGYFAGISIALEVPQLVLIDLTGAVAARTAITASHDPETIAESIAQALPELAAKVAGGATRILGIGISVSGLVDADNKVCLHSALLNWHNVPLADMVARRTGIPTYLANDAKTVATGEKLFGYAKGLENFTILTVGDGIGCASFIGGKLHKGHGGGAGEVAHTTVDLNGRPCKCGKRGCLDTVASREAMLAACQDAGLGISALGELEQLAARSDARALDIIHKAVSALGLIIMQIVHINDPEAVLVIDTTNALGHLSRTIIEQTVATNVLPEMSRALKLKFSKAPEGFWSISAASIAAHQFFTVG